MNNNTTSINPTMENLLHPLMTQVTQRYFPQDTHLMDLKNPEEFLTQLTRIIQKARTVCDFEHEMISRKAHPSYEQALQDFQDEANMLLHNKNISRNSSPKQACALKRPDEYRTTISVATFLQPDRYISDPEAFLTPVDGFHNDDDGSTPYDKGISRTMVDLLADSRYGMLSPKEQERIHEGIDRYLAKETPREREEFMVMLAGEILYHAHAYPVDPVEVEVPAQAQESIQRATRQNPQQNQQNQTQKETPSL